jgi:hypothetical protein
MHNTLEATCLSWDELKVYLNTTIYGLQWDLKGLECDSSGVVSDFLKETVALPPVEQIPKPRKQIACMQTLMGHIQDKLRDHLGMEAVPAAPAAPVSNKN